MCQWTRRNKFLKKVFSSIIWNSLRAEWVEQFFHLYLHTKHASAFILFTRCKGDKMNFPKNVKYSILLAIICACWLKILLLNLRLLRWKISLEANWCLMGSSKHCVDTLSHLIYHYILYYIGRKSMCSIWVVELFWTDIGYKEEVYIWE